MPFLIAAMVLVGVLCMLDLILTLGVIRRLHEHTTQLARMSGSIGLEIPLPPAGTEIADFAGTAVSGERVARHTFDRGAVVGIFSTTCGSCRTHLPDFVGYVAAGDYGPQRTLAVVVGEAGGGRDLVEALRPIATVVVEPIGGPISQAFDVSAFPSYFVMDGNGVITGAAITVDGLAAPAFA